MTQASIPSLVKKGIKGISVGVNDMSPPPAVPSLFIWQYDNASVMATWHPGSKPSDTCVFCCLKFPLHSLYVTVTKHCSVFLVPSYHLRSWQGCN